MTGLYRAAVGLWTGADRVSSTRLSPTRRG